MNPLRPASLPVQHRNRGGDANLPTRRSSFLTLGTRLNAASRAFGMTIGLVRIQQDHNCPIIVLPIYRRAISAASDPNLRARRSSFLTLGARLNAASRAFGMTIGFGEDP